VEPLAFGFERTLEPFSKFEVQSSKLIHALHSQTPALKLQSRPGMSDRGFTLVEVLVAFLLVISVMAGVAGLFGVATRTANDARVGTAMLVMAADKVEAWRAVPWDALNVSPADALDHDEDGFADRLDASGAVVNDDDEAAVYIRRWQVVGAEPGADRALALRVLVMRVAAPVPSRGAIVTTLRTKR
jgi:Tfp pilus assembly protein PilV